MIPIFQPKFPICRPSDAWPEFILREYRRLVAMPDPIVTLVLKSQDSPTFSCKMAVPSFMNKYLDSGSDHAGIQACVSWIREGPKIVNVTEEQYQALAKVEIRLELAEFRSPYPTVLVNVPPGKTHAYVIVHTRDVLSEAGELVPIMIAAAISPDNQSDIITIVRHRPGHDVEESLGTFHDEISEAEGQSTLLSVRVACNMLLAMANFGCQAEYLFPREVEAERKYVARGNRQYRDGTRASDRLAEQPQILTLDRDVKLYHREGGHVAGESTGREIPFHWRRGHWRRARVGTGRQEVRLVFVRPTMVRADLLTTTVGDTTTKYKKG